MILTLWRGKSGSRDVFRMPSMQASAAYSAHVALMDSHPHYVNYYRVTLEDEMRLGHFVKDSDKERGIV